MSTVPTVLPLARGARLIAVTTDRFKCDLLSLHLYHSANAAETQKSCLLTDVLCRGSQKYPTLMALNRHLDDMYSTYQAFRMRRVGDMHSFDLRFRFLGRRFLGGKGLLPDVTALLHEVLFAPLLDEQGLFRANVVEKAKKTLAEEIKSAEKEPRALAMARCRALLCPDEPFGHPTIGTLDTLQDVTPAALTAHYRDLFGGVAPIFFYVGAESPAYVAELLSQELEAFSDRPPQYHCRVAPHVGEVAVGTCNAPVSQSRLALGFRGDVSLTHPLAPALQVLNEIYGESPTSKLFVNVREKHGLCYQCSSSISLQKGVIFATAGVTAEKLSFAKEAMLSELSAIRRGEITDEELENARLSLISTYRKNTVDAPASLFAFYGDRALAGRAEMVEEWCDRLARVTREEVAAVAERLSLGSVYTVIGNEEVAT